MTAEADAATSNHRFIFVIVAMYGGMPRYKDLV